MPATVRYPFVAVRTPKGNRVVYNEWTVHYYRKDGTPVYLTPDNAAALKDAGIWPNGVVGVSGPGGWNEADTADSNPAAL